MTVETEAIVEAVKEHAQEHYDEGGWDVIVECWEDVDIAKVITESTLLCAEYAIDYFRDELVAVWAERQTDAIISGYGSMEAYNRRHEDEAASYAEHVARQAGL
jgi:hypothetical protein